MINQLPDLQVRLARDEDDLRAAQRLRYRVFVTEMGGAGDGVDHAAGIEADSFDTHCQHLVLCDDSRPHGDHVVGVYRLMTREGAKAAGRFYCDSEYDLAPLVDSGRSLLELGRSCLEPDHRGGAGMHLLWQGLADYVLANEIEVLFGVASFHGTDVRSIAPSLSWLHHQHLAPDALRARSRVMQPMDLVPEDAIDRRAAMLAMPALIKAYLRLGGTVGEGAFIDWDFNTTDVLLIMDTARLNEKSARRFRA